MESTPMPEPLRRAVHELVSESIMSCQEVLRYTEPDQAHTWKRMTLYRATDAADTLNLVAMLIAAYCQHLGMSPDTLHSYLQVDQQDNRAAGPQDGDRAHLAGLLGQEPSYEIMRAPQLRMMHGRGKRQAQQAQAPENDPQKLFAEACLHGLKARLSDEVEALDSYLSPDVAALARKVAEVLEEQQPAPA
ncbi:hypothetical protein [Streptomyces sp. NPDC005533]|uniref:hypothetical protein n=1 Tax=Streptomyces sp. NPDC005533 TaxID=3364723 RepID=UPI0036CCC405